MSDHNGASDDATQPVRLRKDDPSTDTERIPVTPQTQRFQRPPEPSTYTSPQHYGSPPPDGPAAFHQQQSFPPQGPPRPQYPVQPYAPAPQQMGPPPAYNSTMVATGRPAASGVVVAIAWILALVTFLYLLPWAVAATRNKSNQGGIFVVNFFLGWSFIGWVVALVMACGTDPQSNVVVVNHAPQQHYYR